MRRSRRHQWRPDGCAGSTGRRRYRTHRHRRLNPASAAKRGRMRRRSFLAALRTLMEGSRWGGDSSEANHGPRRVGLGGRGRDGLAGGRGIRGTTGPSRDSISSRRERFGDRRLRLALPPDERRPCPGPSRGDGGRRSFLDYAVPLDPRSWGWTSGTAGRTDLAGALGDPGRPPIVPRVADAVAFLRHREFIKGAGGTTELLDRLDEELPPFARRPPSQHRSPCARS